MSTTAIWCDEAIELFGDDCAADKPGCKGCLGLDKQEHFEAQGASTLAVFECRAAFEAVAVQPLGRI